MRPGKWERCGNRAKRIASNSVEEEEEEVIRSCQYSQRKQKTRLVEFSLLRMKAPLTSICNFRCSRKLMTWLM